MIPYRAIERWAKRPAHYPKFSRYRLQALCKLRLVNYLIVLAIGLAFLIVEKRSFVEISLYCLSLLLAPTISTYFSCRAKNPPKTYSYGFIFDGIFLGYICVVSDFNHTLIVLSIATQLSSGMSLQGIKGGVAPVASFLFSLFFFSQFIESDFSGSDSALLIIWIMYLLGITQLAFSFQMNYVLANSVADKRREISEQNVELEKLNTQIKEQVLVRYLPPDLINDIFEGKISMDTKPHSQQITVLFSDLSGFTEMSEEQGAEVVAEFLNDYLTIMNETIFANKGTIDKFIGDAIMVIFGAPVEMSEQEQVENAAQCAIAMQRGMVLVNQKWKTKGLNPVSMRIGMHQGKAVVGNFGSPQRVDYTAIGPAVNLAARVETACEPGSVFVSKEFRANLHDDTPADLAGEFELKGIEGKTSLYKLVDWAFPE